MTGNTRATGRTSGRSPPFLVIGLLVGLCIIGFNYFKVRAHSTALTQEIDLLQGKIKTLTTDKLDLDRQHLDAIRICKDKISGSDKLLEKAVNEKKQAQNELISKEEKLTSCQSEMEKEKADAAKCDEDSNGVKEELVKVKEELEKLKEGAKEGAKCDQSACAVYIKNVLSILTKSLGRKAIAEPLQKNNIDTKQFLGTEAPVTEDAKKTTETKKELDNQNHLPAEKNGFPSESPTSNLSFPLVQGHPSLHNSQLSYSAQQQHADLSKHTIEFHQNVNQPESQKFSQLKFDPKKQSDTILEKVPGNVIQESKSANQLDSVNVPNQNQFLGNNLDKSQNHHPNASTKSQNQNQIPAGHSQNQTLVANEGDAFKSKLANQAFPPLVSVESVHDVEKYYDYEMDRREDKVVEHKEDNKQGNIDDENKEDGIDKMNQNMQNIP